MADEIRNSDPKVRVVRFLGHRDARRVWSKSPRATRVGMYPANGSMRTPRSSAAKSSAAAWGLSTANIVRGSRSSIYPHYCFAVLNASCSRYGRSLRSQTHLARRRRGSADHDAAGEQTRKPSGGAHAEPSRIGDGLLLIERSQGPANHDLGAVERAALHLG